MTKIDSFPQIVSRRAGAGGVLFLRKNSEGGKGREESGRLRVNDGRLGEASLPLGITLFGVAFLCLIAPARAGLISSVVEGPATGMYSYNLTVEFQNSDYYDFTLRSDQATLSGYDLLNTVTSLTPGMAVDQVGPSAYGYYVNGITIGSDNNPGYNADTGAYWSYWTGSPTNPVQWNFSETEGESQRMLTPGEADGWVYNDGSVGPQATSFAVPEPGTWVCLVLATAGGLGSRRWRRGGAVSPGGVPGAHPNNPPGFSCAPAGAGVSGCFPHGLRRGLFSYAPAGAGSGGVSERM